MLLLLTSIIVIIQHTKFITIISQNGLKITGFIT